MMSVGNDSVSLLVEFLGHFSVDDKTPLGRFNAALLAAVVTAAIGAFGAFGVAIGKAVLTGLRSFLDRHVIVQRLTLEPVRLEVDQARRVEINCLLVRYGTDIYFEKLASDQERYEGRLQNRILRNRVVSRSVEDGCVEAQINLPIHNRLGTQFKFFFEVEEPNPPAGGIMMKVSDKVQEIKRRERYFKIDLGSKSYRPEINVTLTENAERAAAAASAPSAERAIDERSSAYRIACALAGAYKLPEQDIVRRYKRKRFGKSVLVYRLWFTLADFPRVKTADGLENNMAFPI